VSAAVEKLSAMARADAAGGAFPPLRWSGGCGRESAESVPDKEERSGAAAVSTFLPRQLSGRYHVVVTEAITC
jgi:hypothetical protein